MAKAWLNDIGLSQYSQAFQNHLVDGRMLHSLMKRDLEKHLNVSKKFHQVSILLGIELLYQVNFSREVRTRAGGGTSHSPSSHTGTHCLSTRLPAHPSIHTHPSAPSSLPPSSNNCLLGIIRPGAQFRGSGEPSSKSSLLIRENHIEAGATIPWKVAPVRKAWGFMKIQRSHFQRNQGGGPRESDS